MRRRLLIGAVLAAMAASLLAANPASADPAGSWIVVLKGSVANPTVLAHQQAGRFGARVSHVYSHALKGYSAVMSATEVATLRADPSVAAVVPDAQVQIQAQTLPTGINRIDGELSSTQSGNGSGSVNVDIAIIDTGISTSHPDLNVVGGTNCIGGTSFNDDNGHGSHVAGIAAARDDANGVVGVAPGARLWAVKVLNSAGSGSISQVICGIDWVTAHASTIEVANMSLGGSDPAAATSTCTSANDPMHPAICNSVAAGVTYAVAASNSTANANNFAPASYAEVMTVSAPTSTACQVGAPQRPAVPTWTTPSPTSPTSAVTST